MSATLTRTSPTDLVIAAARDFLGDRLTTNAALREQHSHGEDTQPPVLPDAVAFIQSAPEAAKLLALCHHHRVPVTPFGAGTSLEGHVTPVRGGISLDLSRMNRVLEVNAADMDCRIEPGVTRQQLNEHLRDQGLFFPVDPGSECTIGGMCATRASGTAAVRYGTIRENVLGLQVALPDGRLIRTGGRVRKSATGYDLTHLMIGSEGTLGVITEIQLRLHGIPEAMSAAICQFGTLQGAVDSVIAILQAGIPIARIELIDDVQMAGQHRLLETRRLPSPSPPSSSSSTAPKPPSPNKPPSPRRSPPTTAPPASNGPPTPTQRNHLWKARHDAYWAALALIPGCKGIATDAIVPISRLADLIVGAKADILESGLTAPIVGHVGDGNFHTVILVPPGETSLEAAWALDKKIVARALSLGGSCSGEHGVGIGKREFLEQEHGVETLAVMRQIKTALDPAGIMNPGKLFLN